MRNDLICSGIMDNYIIGSVADFISKDKGIQIKPKKNKKLILKKIQEETEVKLNKEIKTEKLWVKKKKNEKFFKEEETEKVKLTKKNPKNELLVKKKKKTKSLPNENEPAAKKKKSLTNDDSNLSVSFTREIADTLDIKHVPSDSEEENQDNPSETTTTFKNKKKAMPSKKFEYKDFTENTIFVGNIPINYDKQKICKVFSKFGKIQSARIRCVPIADINMSKKVAAVKKQFNPKRNSLVAYVKYESQGSADAALEANGMVIDGHHLRIDRAEEVKERDNNKAVFVGGLPFNIEDDELWEFFENCGKINSVRIIRDSQTSMGKGFGYVNFDSTTSVELALQMDGQTLKKRQINVKRCVKAKNKNKQDTFGRNKSKKLSNQILPNRGKNLKTDEKKVRMEKKSLMGDFQGRKANLKEKKKKKLSKSAIQKRKVIKILGTS